MGEKVDLMSFQEYQNVIDSMSLREQYLSNQYIFEKIDLLIHIHKMKLNLGDVYINSLEYHNLCNSYHDIVVKISQLFRDFRIYNPISIFSIYSYLLKNGYLSYQHEFVFEKNINDCYPLLGVNIMEGRAVCRHISTLLCDIYRELGFESYKVSTILDRNVTSFPQLDMKKIEGEDVSKSLLSRLLIHYPPYNHLVTLVNHPVYGSLIVDATNDTIFTVRRDKKIESILDKDRFIDCDIESIFNEDMYYNMKKILVPTNPDLLSYLSLFYSQGINFSLKNSYYFEKFYQSNKDYYSDVMKQKRTLSYEFNKYMKK